MARNLKSNALRAAVGFCAVSPVRLRELRGQDSGSVVPIFAGFVSLGVMLAGGVFDFSRYMNAQAMLQNSTDQAALVAKNVEARYVANYGILRQAEGRSKGENEARAFYQASVQPKYKLMGTGTPPAPTFTWDDATGNVTVNSVATIPSFFNSSVFPADLYRVKATAQATFDVGMATEIALVLDNTTSMFSYDGRSKTRFTLMREATLTFVNNVFDSAKVSNNPDAVRVAVVPFATTVNIRGEAPAAQNFNSFSYTTPTDAGTMQQVSSPMSRSGQVNVTESDYAPVSWRGCVAGDVEQGNNTSDGPVTGWSTTRVSSSGFPSNYSYRTTSNGNGNGNGNNCNGATQIMTACPTSSYSNLFLKTPLTCLASRPNSCTTQSTINSMTRTIQPCVADYNEPGIQNGTVQWCSWIPRTQWENYGGGTPSTAGPNENCPSPILGLSGNRRQVIESVNRMSPATGGTHQDVGLRWGMRTLAPTGGWPAFFGLTQAPKPWGPTVDKVVVLITDGQNTQASSPGFWGTSAGRSSLDSMMLNWCTALRDNYKVKIYTVAVNVNDSTAIDLLKSCVGPGNDKRAFTVDAANLQDALRSIGRELTKLKLVR